MFDPKRRVKFYSPYTTDQLIEELKKYPNTDVCICGSSINYIHVDLNDDGSINGITLDCEPLDEHYPEPEDDSEDDEDD